MIDEIIPNYCETFQLKTKLHINAFIASFLDADKLERILETKIILPLDLIDYVQTYRLQNTRLIDKFIHDFCFTEVIHSLIPIASRIDWEKQTNIYKYREADIYYRQKEEEQILKEQFKEKLN